MFPDRRSTMVLRRLHTALRPFTTLAESQAVLSAHYTTMSNSTGLAAAGDGHGLRELPALQATCASKRCHIAQ